MITPNPRYAPLLCDYLPVANHVWSPPKTDLPHHDSPRRARTRWTRVGAVRPWCILPLPCSWVPPRSADKAAIDVGKTTASMAARKPITKVLARPDTLILIILAISMVSY